MTAFAAFSDIEHPSAVRLSEVLSGLSYALDLTEGHPRGHSARACLIGMRIARELALPAGQQSDLFYALLLKDAGCSSNAARVSQLFGGSDQEAKRDVWLRDWRSWREQLAYGLAATAHEPSTGGRVRRLLKLAWEGPGARRELFQLRCDRGAEIARTLGFPERTWQAVRSMDEHWDGGGYPDGAARERIPLEARIVNLAQVLEIFWHERGPDAALEVVEARGGRWFDPELVRVAAHIARDAGLAGDLEAADLPAAVSAAEPEERALPVDAGRLDLIAAAFALVVDAKSSFTYQHSARVAGVAVFIAEQLGLSEAERVRLRRVGLLHDIGKLGVPNRILDKPGTLEPEEWAVIERHAYWSEQILARVPVFREFARDAGAHHERLDGKGYHRGLKGDQLSRDARILAVADRVDALSADRPYRGRLDAATVRRLVDEDSGPGLCPAVVEAVLPALDMPIDGFAGYGI
ncbi:MAG TPA: HD domain-containing phosphohydrolase [Vicinamibacterales bacterium]|nr:HD domain-containing phosphohydrolase [Vicinamibacterales bacterium]